MDKYNGRKLTIFGSLVGLTSGFFGIGGGFLVVPSLMAAKSLSKQRQTLNYIFSSVVITVAIYMIIINF